MRGREGRRLRARRADGRPTLLAHGASSLGVALVDEGIELREAGIDADVLLLSEAPATSLRDAIDARLTLTVGSLHGARELAAVPEHRAAMPVHVKVDTGMHRQGVAPRELREVLMLLAAAGVRVGGVWTHFPVADGAEPSTDAFTATSDVLRARREGRRGRGAARRGAARGEHRRRDRLPRVAA